MDSERRPSLSTIRERNLERRRGGGSKAIWSFSLFSSWELRGRWAIRIDDSLLASSRVRPCRALVGIFLF